MRMIDPIRNPKGFTTKEEWERNIVSSTALVKSVLGVCNNATFLYVVEALEALQGHPRYKGRVRHLFENARKEFKRYEGNLLYADKNRFFHVDDMPEHVRKMYGEDFTDRDFFEYWQGLGGAAYMKTRTLITRLANVYKNSFVRNRIEQPEIMASALAADSLFGVCESLFKYSVKEASHQFGLPHDWCLKVFRPFSLKQVSETWRFALLTLEPSIAEKLTTDLEEKNIEHGILDLVDAWSDPTILYDSMSNATDDFAELFRNKKEFRNVKAENNTVKHEHEARVKEIMIKKIKNKLNIA